MNDLHDGHFSFWYIYVELPGLAQLLSGEVSACNARAAGDVVRSLGQEGTLEEHMVTHSSILAWRITWTEEPGKLQSVGWQRVGQD